MVRPRTAKNNANPRTAAGVGKTEVCGGLAARGYETMNEEFLAMPRYKLDPRSVTMECLWATQWVQAVMKRDRDAGARDRICISDRSPFSAAYYAKAMGPEIEALFRAQREELRKDAGIHIYTVYLYAEADVIWERVQRRLRIQTVRADYGEDDRGWLDRTLAYYNSSDREWDFSVGNSHNIAIDAVVDHIIEHVIPNIKSAIGGK